MHIMHIVTSMQLRGAEIFAADLMHWLRGQGVTQTVAVLRPTEEEVRFDATVDVYPSDRPASFPLLPRWLNKKAAKPVDIIQAHGGEALKQSVLAGLHRKAPLAYRRIGTAPQWLRRGPRRYLYSRLFSRATRTIALTEAIARESVDDFHVAPERIVVIPNGVDAARIQYDGDAAVARRELHLEPDAFVVTSAISLTWEKDPLLHVDVGQAASEVQAHLVHLIVGDGPMKEGVSTHVLKAQDPDRVRLLGKRADMGRVFAATDVLLFASRPDGMEGMPASIIEAGMCGVPAVARMVPGLDEVVQNDATGILAGNDAGSLSDAISRLAADAALRDRLGRTARERYTNSFDISSIGSKYLKLYEAMLG